MTAGDFFTNVVATIRDERGMDHDQAVHRALGACRRWAAGHGDVPDEVRGHAGEIVRQLGPNRPVVKASVTYPRGA